MKVVTPFGDRSPAGPSGPRTSISGASTSGESRFPASSQLDIPDVPLHVWAIGLVLTVLLVSTISFAQVLTENQAPIALPAPTVTVTCPAPREAEALVITVTSAGRHHCGIYTGRAY